LCRIPGSYQTYQHQNICTSMWSAGGLLMGHANMRPDLWNGVIAAQCLVDVVTNWRSGCNTHPLPTNMMNGVTLLPIKKVTITWNLILHDNGEKKDYPNMLVTTIPKNDSQVYFEPAKW
jgi:oligopeptidase B